MANNGRMLSDTHLYRRYQEEATALPLLDAAQERRLAQRIDCARQSLLAALAGWPPSVASLLEDCACTRRRDGVIQSIWQPAAAPPPDIDAHVDRLADRHRTFLGTLAHHGWHHHQTRRCRRELALTLCDLRPHHTSLKRMLTRVADEPPPAPDQPGTQPQARIAAAQQWFEAEKERLVHANLRLVMAIARRYRHCGVPLCDLIQEGNIGLLRAVEKFDHRRGCRFSAYAGWWIQRAMLLAITAQRSALSVPVYALQAALRAQRDIGLCHQAGRPAPSLAALARRAGMAPADLRAACVASVPALALEAETEDGCTPLDVLRDDRQPDPSEAVMHDDLCRHVRATLARLPARQAQVLALRFGIGRGEPATLEAIGRQLGLTRERIRQIEQEALLHLRRPTLAEPLRPLLDCRPAHP